MARSQNTPSRSRTVAELPTFHVGSVPDLDARNWTLGLEGAISDARIFGLRAFLALPRTHWTGDLTCVMGWEYPQHRWSGIPLAALVDLVQPKAAASHVQIADGGLYDAVLPLSDALAGQVLFATELDGRALSLEHGGPVRAVVPGRDATHFVKWVRTVKFLTESQAGFWERRGLLPREDSGRSVAPV